MLKQQEYIEYANKTFKGKALEYTTNDLIKISESVEKEIDINMLGKF